MTYQAGYTVSKEPSSEVVTNVRTAIVSGAAGFLGNRLVRVLLRGSFAVRAVDDLSAGRADRLPVHPRLAFIRADICSNATWQRLLEGIRSADVIVHLASVVGVARVLRDPEACYRRNVDGCGALARTLAAMPRCERPAVMFASSSEVYASSDCPLTETSPVRCIRDRGRFAYAASKLVGERLIAEVAGDRAISARFFNVVGPDQDAASGMVLPRFIEAARRGRALTVYGDGTQLRTWAHVDDVAETLGWLLHDGPAGGGPLNVGGRTRARVLDVVAALEHVSGLRLPVEHVDPRRTLGLDFAEIPYREPDLRRLESLGCPVPSASLEVIVGDAWARHPDAEQARGEALSDGNARRRSEPACEGP